MVSNYENLGFSLKLISDFKKTQPRKKRQNIDKAFRKLTKGERLNGLEWEACQKLQDFILNYKAEESDEGFNKRANAPDN